MLKFIEQAKDLIFPTVCANCGRLGEMICDECQSRIAWLEEPMCQLCGRMSGREVCRECEERPITPLTQLRSTALYQEPLDRIIKQFKYNSYFNLAKPLASLMAQAWPHWSEEIDLIVPAPLHKKRERQRGYSQSHLLAQELASAVFIPYSATAIQRVRHTPPQVGLSSTDRQKNLVDAFTADEKQVSGKSILIIDDVVTTGATLVESAKAVQKSGAKYIFAYCIATTT